MAEHRPRKRFGQNFLHDRGVIDKIVSAIAPKPEDNLVEIGPGQGALTCQLLPLLKQMHAIELDRDLIPTLQQRCSSLGDLTIHSSDVLKFDFGTLFQPNRPLRVVGNLPYNISTPLLFHLLQQRTLIEDMHFMLQKEVVDRLAAAPNSGNYGRLSVMVQRHCRVEPLFTIGPGAFNPPPKIHSSVVRLTPWHTPPVDIVNEQHFAELVSSAFAQRRKTLRNSLKSLVHPEQFAAAAIDPTRRAETLTLKEFATLSNRCQ
jgi:16S rRNA (adenine1518-N6/adenine1519-N6)-dimethyltransferase